MTDIAERPYRGDWDGYYEPRLAHAWTQPEPYIASPSLTMAVNTALYLRRPLLLEGDPGCGKTRLARAVAYQLGYPLKECYIRSTSRAQDLLYEYDAVSRLYDIQEHRALGDEAKAIQQRIQTREAYVTLGPLGEAIALAQQDKPSVVLIDEIDKADFDFPNDLLQVLDEFRFEIAELKNRPDKADHSLTTLQEQYDALQGETRAARRHALPVVIITSNREKELPKPFLRRCLFHYVRFPDEATLKRIVSRHKQQPLTPLFEQAVKLFWALRNQKQFRWRKIPSTSELLDWIDILERDEQAGQLTTEQLKAKQMSDLFAEETTLVKTQNDMESLRKLS